MTDYTCLLYEVKDAIATLTQKLALRALGAVEEQALAPAAKKHRRGRAMRGRHRARGTEKDKIEVHGPS